MQPIPGETPQIDWPVVTVGSHRLVLRWSFYVTWLLSKRRVQIKDLRAQAQSLDPALVDTMVEMFAAMVAENFTERGQPAPTADYWAMEISKCAPGTWERISGLISEAIKKAPPMVAAPTPETATQGMTQ